MPLIYLTKLAKDHGKTFRVSLFHMRAHIFIIVWMTNPTQPLYPKQCISPQRLHLAWIYRIRDLANYCILLFFFKKLLCIFPTSYQMIFMCKIDDVIVNYLSHIVASLQ